MPSFSWCICSVSACSLIAHLKGTHGGGERQCHWLQAKPDMILWLCAVHRSVLPQFQCKGKAWFRERAYVPCYFWKISKAALLKEKRAQLWNHFLLFKLFYSRKKTRGLEKKKIWFFAFALFLGLSIPATLWDDTVCQIPTAPLSASGGQSPPHTIALLSEAAGTLPAHADSISAWRTAPLWGSSPPLGARQQGTRRAGHVRQLTNKKLLCSLLPPKHCENADRGKDALLLAAAAWLCLGVQPAGQLQDTRLWKFKSQMNSSLLPNSQWGYLRLSSISTKILRWGMVFLPLPMLTGLPRAPVLVSFQS